MNKLRFLILGKVILFMLTYITLAVIIGVIAQSFLPTGNNFYSQVPFVIIQYAIPIFVLILFVKIIDKENVVSSVGLSLKNHVKEFFVGGFAGTVCILIGLLIIIGLKWSQFALSSYIKIDYLLINAFLFMCVAITEEALMRGYVLRKLTTAFPVIVSLLISSSIFALLHLFNSNMTFWSVTNIFLAGILLGVLYLKTKNIWLAVGFHFSWNYIQSILGFPVSGEEQPSIFALNFEEMNSFNGGYFGFEGSYVCTIILIISVIASRDVARRVSTKKFHF